MKRIVFEYRDAYTNGNWNRQECVVENLREAIQFYGLDICDCEYRIISIEEV